MGRWGRPGTQASTVTALPKTSRTWFVNDESLESLKPNLNEHCVSQLLYAAFVLGIGERCVCMTVKSEQVFISMHPRCCLLSASSPLGPENRLGGCRRI